MRRVKRGSITSELIMCRGGVRSILLLPRVARCLETIDVCIVYSESMFYVCCSDCVGVCGYVCCVPAVDKESVLSLGGVLKYSVCSCKGCDGWFFFWLYCEAWSCRCSCKCFVMQMLYVCMFVSCVHPVAILNAEFSMLNSA